MTRADAAEPRLEKVAAAEARGMPLEEAVRKVHLQAGRLGGIHGALKQLLGALKLPLETELREMREGARPISLEAHLIGALRRAVVELETCEEDLRLAIDRRIFERLEEEWRQGSLPHKLEFRQIEAAVAALRNGAGGRR